MSVLLVRLFFSCFLPRIHVLTHLWFMVLLDLTPGLLCCVYYHHARLLRPGTCADSCSDFGANNKKWELNCLGYFATARNLKDNSFQVFHCLHEKIRPRKRNSWLHFCSWLALTYCSRGGGCHQRWDRFHGSFLLSLLWVTIFKWIGYKLSGDLSMFAALEHG
jgi:hypothetical protein